MGKRKLKINKKKIKRNLKVLLFIVCIVIIINKFKVKDIEIENNLLMINNEKYSSKLENEIIEQNGIVYMSFNDIKNLIDETIYQEQESGLVITTSDKKVAALEIDNSDIEINGSKVSIDGQIFKNQDGIIYLPISELENVYDAEINYIQESKNITIDFYSNKMVNAEAKKKIYVKEKMSGFSKNVDVINKGDEVVYIDEEETVNTKWVKVRTKNGILGYAKKNKFINIIIKREEMKKDNDDDDEKILEKDITKEKISNYEERKTLINKIIEETFTKQYKKVKIKYEKDITLEEYIRFKIEIVPILKECGIKVIL